MSEFSLPPTAYEDALLSVYWERGWWELADGDTRVEDGVSVYAVGAGW